MMRGRFVHIAAAVLLIALLAAMAWWTGLDQPVDYDEIHHHLPSIRLFMKDWPSMPLSGYESASGPVPYWLWAGWGKWVGDSLVAFRLLTLLLASACVLLLALLARRETPDRRTLLFLLMVLQPYFIARAFSLYTLVPAFFFGLLALVAYDRSRDERASALWLGVYAAAAALAIWSRQFYLSYAVGIAASFLLERFGSRRSHKRVWLRGVAVVLPLAALAVLIWVWGGTTPPGYAGNASRGLNLMQVDFAFIFLGLWFLPVFLDNLTNLPKWWLLLGAFLALHMLAGPLYMADPAAVGLAGNTVTGVIPKALLMLKQIGIPVLGLHIVQTVAWWAGFGIAWFFVSHIRQRYVLIALAHVGILLFVPHVWERYYLAVVPVLWLALADRIQNKRLYWLWVVLQALVVGRYVMEKVN